MRIVSFYLILFALSALCPGLQAQQVTEHEAVYSWFDQEVGIENTGLYEGFLYKEQYRTINSLTQFFKSPGFLSGAVIYKGQPYSGLQLKYDVYADQVLLKVPDRLGGNTLRLVKEEISEFHADGHHFVRLINIPGLPPGFYEVSYEGNALRLLTRYNKKRFARKNLSSLYYEFITGKATFVIAYQDQYVLLERRRDLLELFPGLEREINSFYRRARVKRRTDPYGFMVDLAKRLNSLL